jgi:DNA-binding PadR family transcriptional regulator
MKGKVARDFILGFIRMHILHNASLEPVFGLDMIRELQRHDFHISPGTLYPILHTLEREGYLVSEKRIVDGKVRKYYRSTPHGIEALKHAVIKGNELLSEITQAHLKPEEDL